MDIINYQQEDYPRIKCDIHNSNFIEYINKDVKKGRVLNCVECVTDGELIGSNLIPLIRIFKNDSNDFTVKTAFYKNKSLVKQAQSLYYGKKHQENINQIENHFNELKNTMISLIEENKKKIITHLNLQADLSKKLINDIQETHNTNQFLQSMRREYSNDVRMLNQLLKNYINKMNETEQKQETEILNKIEELKKLEQLVSLSDMKNLSNDLARIYQGFPYLKQDSMNLINDIKKTSSENKQEDRNNNTFKINSENQIFSSDLVRIYQGFPYLKHDLMNLINDIKKVSCENKQEDRKCKTFKINQENLIQDNYMNEELLPRLKVKKSKLGDPNSFSINVLSNNEIEMENGLILNVERQFYIDHILEANKKYEITVKLLKKKEYIFLGITPIKSIHKKDLLLNLHLFISNTGISFIKKGSSFDKIIENIDTLCFQIYLKEKVLQCYTIVNGEQHVMSLQQLSDLKDNEQYYFNVFTYVDQTKLRITSFKEVKEFTAI